MKRVAVLPNVPPVRIELLLDARHLGDVGRHAPSVRFHIECEIQEVRPRPASGIEIRLVGNHQALAYAQTVDVPNVVEPPKIRHAQPFAQRGDPAESVTPLHDVDGVIARIPGIKSLIIVPTARGAAATELSTSRKISPGPGKGEPTVVRVMPRIELYLDTFDASSGSQIYLEGGDAQSVSPHIGFTKNWDRRSHAGLVARM